MTGNGGEGEELQHEARKILKIKRAGLNPAL
jgi:hypothetical protein